MIREWLLGLRDVWIVDLLDVGQREAGLRSVGTAAGGVGRSRCRLDREVVTTQVAEAVAFEEQLTTTILDELGEYLRRRLTSRVVRSEPPCGLRALR